MMQTEQSYHVLRDAGWHWIDCPPLRVQHVCVGGTDVPIHEAVSTVNGWRCPSCGLECKTWDLPGYDAQIVQTDKLVLEGHPVRFAASMITLVSLGKDGMMLYQDIGLLISRWLDPMVPSNRFSTAFTDLEGPLVRVTVEIVKEDK